MMLGTSPLSTAPVAYASDIPIRALLQGVSSLRADLTMRGMAGCSLSGRAALAATAGYLRYSTANLSGNAAWEAVAVSIYRGNAWVQGSAKLSANTGFAVYAASTDYVTAVNDNPASTLFRGTVKTPLRFERSIIGGSNTLITATTIGFGETYLDNADGLYDTLADTCAIDGRRIIIKLGATDFAYAKFGVVFDGTASGWHTDESVLRIKLRDLGYLLDKNVQEKTYAGTGGIDGDENAKGKRVPLCYGSVENITPQLLNTDLIYQVHDGSVQSIATVYDRGATLTPSADYPDYASLKAATIPSIQFATCKALGLFRLGGSPAGLVTCDVQGDNTGGYVSTTADIIVRIITGRVGVSPSMIDTATVTACNAASPGAVGIFIGDTETKASELVSKLSAGIGAFAGFRRDGKFQITVFYLPSGTPKASFSDIEILKIERLDPPSTINPPNWRRRAIYRRNWTVQDSDIAGIVTDERRAFLKEATRLAEASDATVKQDHLLATDPDPVESYYAEESAASAEAQRLLSMYKKMRSLYRVIIKTVPFVLDVGDCVSITCPRWNLKTGKLLRIVSIIEDADDNYVEIQAFG